MKSWYGDPCCRCKGSNEPYMLTFQLWKCLVKKSELRKFICIGCIENQLNRKLVLKDFIDAPINFGVFGFDCRVYIKIGAYWNDPKFKSLVS